MARLDTSLPNTVTLTNNTGSVLKLTENVTLAAGASGVVVDLTKYAARVAVGQPTPSIREQIWDAIVLAARADGPRGTGLVTITASSPTVTPTAAIDYTGERLAGVAAGSVYGKGAADNTVHSGLNPYATGAKGSGAGFGPGAADNTIRTV